MADRCLLYYITDRSQFGGEERACRRALLAKLAEAVSAGVDYIQLREKDLNSRELEMLARDAWAEVLNSISLGTENQGPRTGVKTRLLINSRTDVALAAGADGVHLRSEDISASDVRAIWRSCGAAAHVPPPIVAVSCHTAADVLLAEAEEASFAVFAPVFGKRSGAGTGIAALHDACRAKIPVLALGGITLDNALSCLDAGAAGVAGIRLFQENKVEDVVRALRVL
jgi:thiamine-phosphate pyrophosphorylase